MIFEWRFVISLLQQNEVVFCALWLVGKIGLAFYLLGPTAIANLLGVPSGQQKIFRNFMAVYF